MQIDVDNIEKDITFAHIRKERNYNYEDLIEIHPDTLPDYENKVKRHFFFPLNSLKGDSKLYT